MSTMRISRLAERTGVPATTLRFYETAGLLPAERTPSGYRVYGEDAVRRLEFIGAAKHLGLPLEEIAELLAVWESGACAAVKADLRPRLAARLDVAETRHSELEVFIATLRRALGHLDALPDRDEPCGPQCELLDAEAVLESDNELRSEPAATPEPAIACTLTGSDQRDRSAEWRTVLDGATRVETPDGLRLTIPADRAAAVADLAAAEQRCCPFLRLSLHFADGRLALEVRAPDEAADLVSEMFSSSL